MVLSTDLQKRLKKPLQQDCLGLPLDGYLPGDCSYKAVASLGL